MRKPAGHPPVPPNLRPALHAAQRAAHLPHGPHLHDVGKLLVHDAAAVEGEHWGGGIHVSNEWGMAQTGSPWLSKPARSMSCGRQQERQRGGKPAIVQPHRSVNSPLEILSSSSCCWSSCKGGGAMAACSAAGQVTISCTSAQRAAAAAFNHWGLWAREAAPLLTPNKLKQQCGSPPLGSHP